MHWLENDVLKLRALEPEDLSCLYAWENDTRLWKYGNTLSPYSKFVLHQYLEQAHRDLYDSRQLRLMMVEKSTESVVGTLDLYDFEPFHNRAGIGILLDKAFQGKGFASQGLQLMKDYAFNFLHLHQLYAYIPAENLPSLRLFRRAGYVETGCLKQWNRTNEGWCDVFVYQLISDFSGLHKP